MESLPQSGFFTYYFLENPWPAVVVLVVAAIILFWRAKDRGGWAVIAFPVCILLAIVVAVVSFMVVTAGEHARETIAQLLRDAESGNVAAMQSHFLPESSLHFGSLTRPGLDWREIDRGLNSLAGANRIVSNTVTSLKGATVNGDEGIVMLACLTTTQLSMGPVPSTWIFRVHRESDGSWAVIQVVSVTIGGSASERPAW